jgi:hypothetical protein
MDRMRNQGKDAACSFPSSQKLSSLKINLSLSLYLEPSCPLLVQLGTGSDAVDRHEEEFPGTHQLHNLVNVPED